MTAQEFAKSELEHVGHMLDVVFTGLDPDLLDRKALPRAMSMRETAVHLAECYQCAIVVAGGGKHEWGSYLPSTLEWPALLHEMQRLRAKAVAACLDGTDEGLERAYDYVIAHDNYHVGQLCLIRIDADGGWDSYSIYGM